MNGIRCAQLTPHAHKTFCLFLAPPFSRRRPTADHWPSAPRVGEVCRVWWVGGGGGRGTHIVWCTLCQVFPSDVPKGGGDAIRGAVPLTKPALHMGCSVILAHWQYLWCADDKVAQMYHFMPIPSTCKPLAPPLHRYPCTVYNYPPPCKMHVFCISPRPWRRLSHTAMQTPGTSHSLSPCH